MYYELALISVVIGGGYWGFHFTRVAALRLYGLLNLGAAALAGLGFYGARQGDGSFGVAGAIGVGAGACLLLVGPVARGFARRAAAAERFGIAKVLLDVADVLAPGSGVGDEKALLAAMRQIRDGNIEQTVEALTAAKRQAPADAQLAIDERIAMLYLASYRWDEAIAHAEEHLFGAIPPTPKPGEGVALRRALGLAPPVWVELLGAYGYTGNLDQAARMLARLEEVCAGRPDATIWVHRGRLIFLALAGRVSAVEKLVEPKRSRHMKPAARSYWRAVAHERRGEAADAEAAYAKARAKSRGRPRVLIDQALARLPNAKPVELGPTATEVVTRVEAEPPPAVTAPVRQRGPIATRLLVVVMVLVAAMVTLLVGPSGDVGVLVRDGALVRGLVRDGEWWRLVSCIFVHVGGMHLVLNVLGLLFVGRLTEEMFGAWRTLAIFAVASLAGAVGSYLALPSGISAGASGGIMGISGAVLAELTVHRKRHRGAWRGLWGAIAVVVVAQLALGWLYSAMDMWAHAGGLAGGALAAIALSPSWRIHKATLHAARVVGTAFVVASCVAAVQVIRTPVAESVGRAHLERVSFSDVSAVVPASWVRLEDELFDPDLVVSLRALRVRPKGTLDELLAVFRQGEEQRAKDRDLDRVTAAPEAVFPVPAGWQGSELIASYEDALGTRQGFRVFVGVRADGPDAVILATLYVPETIARGAPGFYSALIASLEAR